MTLNFKRRNLKAFFQLHWDTIADVFFIVTTTVLATIIKIISYGLDDNNGKINYVEILKDGSFLMYSFSFLTSAYIIHNYQLKGTDSKNAPKIILPFLLILSTAYTMIDNNKSPNAEFIYNVSIIPFILSLLVFYHAQLTYNKTNRVVDIGDQRRNEISAIENSLS